jgi:hypothetical protein
MRVEHAGTLGEVGEESHGGFGPIPRGIGELAGPDQSGSEPGEARLAGRFGQGTGTVSVEYP